MARPQWPDMHSAYVKHPPTESEHHACEFANIKESRKRRKAKSLFLNGGLLFGCCAFALRWPLEEIQNFEGSETRRNIFHLPYYRRLSEEKFDAYH
jgi:hypothetical protein